MRAVGRTAFLSDHFRQQTETLEQEVQNMSEIRLVAFNESSLLDGLTQKYAITPLALDWANQSMTPQIKTIPASARPGNGFLYGN